MPAPDDGDQSSHLEELAERLERKMDGMARKQLQITLLLFFLGNLIALLIG